jgi:soluble lytic murein transglycosylase-like protein
MMIARIRESRGDEAAQGLIKSLKTEARRIGMRLPKWVDSPNRVIRCDSYTSKDVVAGKYDSLIERASEKYILPPALIKAVIHAESAFMHEAVSDKGAQGLMQLMPATADEIGVRNAFDPRANVFGGSLLLRRYLDRYGSLKKTLIAYNAGPEWTKRKRIPNETKKYLRRVIYYYRLYKETT